MILLTLKYLQCIYIASSKWLRSRERLVSEKQNKASAAGARLPKKAMLLRDIFKFTKCIHMVAPWDVEQRCGEKLVTFVSRPLSG